MSNPHITAGACVFRDCFKLRFPFAAKLHDAAKRAASRAAPYTPAWRPRGLDARRGP